jgi:hypothetical protein
MPDPRQKRLAKQKKKRSRAGRKAVDPVSPETMRQMGRELIGFFPKVALGPHFITRGWDDPNAPRLQCIVATRKNDEGLLFPVVILVDLGCEGVLDANFAGPATTDGVAKLLSSAQEMFPRGFEEIDPSLASTIVHQAELHASKIGIQTPDRMKPELSILSDVRADVEVELGRQGKHLYSPDPDEDMKPMVKRLVQALGPDGFHVELPAKEGT